MARRSLRHGGNRPKAFLGLDAGINAAAVIAAASMQVAATAAAANKQAKAVKDNAQQQAQALEAQNENNNANYQKSIEFTKEQNNANRELQKDTQMSLQMLAGQQNANDIKESTKMQLKYGGAPKRKNKYKSLKTIGKSNTSYGGAQNLFKVTDGGGVLPLQVDQYGYGLYEVIGNDHEHYHKAPGGKNKTGVGIKFNDGSVVEGEGNQNTNQGELLYVTPKDTMFLSKHSIDGFNPTKAVLAGMSPEESFAIQEQIKAIKGYNDDGTKTKKAMYGTGTNVLDFQNQMSQANFANLNTNNIAVGVASATNPIDEYRDAKKCGGRTKRRKAWYGTTLAGINSLLSAPYKPSKTSLANTIGPVVGPDVVPINVTNSATNTTSTSKSSFLDNYGGALASAGANLVGAGITTIGNMISSNKLGKAYTKAGNIIADAYRNMKGIDLSSIKRSDFAAPHTMAAVRSSYVNINPQLQRIKRDADSQKRAINRNTLSSASRLTRIAETDDRAYQRMAEQYANKTNAEESIRNSTLQIINNTAKENADRDVQANRDYTGYMLKAMQYNNDISNQSIAGAAQAQADAMTQSVGTTANALQSSIGTIGQAITTGGQAFASAYDANRVYRENYNNLLIGFDNSDQVESIISKNDRYAAQQFINRNANSSNPTIQRMVSQLKTTFGIK